MFKIIILDKIKNLRIKEINLSVKIIRLNGENKNLYIEAVGDTYHSFHKLFFLCPEKERTNWYRSIPIYTFHISTTIPFSCLEFHEYTAPRTSLFSAAIIRYIPVVQISQTISE